jgi:peptidoglycan/xylan/chitin deacetylase (PgdA/CDA1 family)
MRASRAAWLAAALLACAPAPGRAPRTEAGTSAPPRGIPVLVYHEIRGDGAPPGETVISLERFEEQMDHLAREGWRTLSMDELLAFMRGERPFGEERAVVLTFDDGWRSALNAIPALERHGFQASFWIIAHAGIGGENLDWADVQRIDAHPHFEVGSHTAHHPWDPLQNLVTWVDGRVPGRGVEDVRAELEGSRHLLEARLGRPVRRLAWPCGWYNERLIALAREAGYEAILTTDDGPNRVGDDPLRIRRVNVDGSCDLASFASILEEPRYRSCAAQGGPGVRRQLHSPYPLGD